jgi:hypothetical protein
MISEWWLPARSPILKLLRARKNVFFHFWSIEIEYFYEATIETWNQKLGTTPHITNRPPKIYISAIVLLWHLRRYILDFMQAPTDFRWTEVVLHFSGNKTSSWFFAKIIFRFATCYFFTKLWSLRRKSAPPGHERPFLVRRHFINFINCQHVDTTYHPTISINTWEQ